MSSYVRPTSSYTHPTKRRSFSAPKKINRKPWRYLGWVLWVVLLLWALIDFGFVSNERFFMKKIAISYSGLVVFSDLPDDDIVSALVWKHFFLTKYRRVVPKLIASEPLINDIVLQPSSQTWTYNAIVTYASPQMMFRFADREYGLIDNILYPLRWWVSGMKLQIPSYFTGMTLSGLFYDVPAEQLITQYQTIVRGLANKDIQAMTYHPAAHQIQVNTLKQEIYFDVKGNIFEQLKKYRSLLDNQNTIVDQRIVDVGSVEDGAFVYP
jgi:hypothetical protein